MPGRQSQTGTSDGRGAIVQEERAELPRAWPRGAPLAEPTGGVIAAQRASGKSTDWRDSIIAKQHQEEWQPHLTQADDPAVHTAEATGQQVST